MPTIGLTQVRPDVIELLTNPFLGLTQRFIQAVPRFVAAFLFLLAGLFFARILRTVAERLLERTRIDEALGKVGITELLTRLGLGRSPSFVVSFLVYWFVLLAFFVSAANALDLTIVSQVLERFLLFLPSMVAALLILFGGLVFASFLAGVVTSAATANSIRGGEILGKAAYVFTVGFAVLTAAQQLGLQVLLLSSSFQIILAAAGLAFALAFGLGGKSIAEEILREALNRPPK
ncbi:MAG: hypothetical protein NTX64_17780 [Elusimicrobia bacterium]|nr:hypothetical protein [Elusimicrobiota bacterium]